MKELIVQFFEKCITAAENNIFTRIQIETLWIGNAPATEREIAQAENKLGLVLPADYKNLLKIANGFPAFNDAVEPSFHKIQEIQYLRDYSPETINIERKSGTAEIAGLLNKSIVVAGMGEEQWFLLIPPTAETGKWKYWKFANWIPGEIEFENLEAYFLDVISFINDIGTE